jgi:hypothetical protein
VSLTGAQEAFLRAYEFLFRQAAACAQLCQSAQFISQRHKQLPSDAPTAIEHRNGEKVPLRRQVEATLFFGEY